MPNHFLNLKVLKKAAIYTLALLLVTFLSLVASVFIFKDRIIQQFIREANKSLNTPMKIGKIDVTMLEDFPRMSIVCRDVEIEDSHPGEYPLFTAKSVAFQLNPLEVWRGIYTIRGLSIRNSETNLKINRKGETNFNILKKDSTSERTGNISFSLNNVRLKSTTVHYTDKKADQDFKFLSDQLKATIETEKNIYLISTKGDVSTDKLKVGKTSLLSGKDFLIETSLRYFDEDRRLIIEPSTIQVNESNFYIKGEYAWKNRNVIDLQAEGKDTDIQTLL